MRTLALLLILLALRPAAALAQGPHEIALIVHANDPDSIEIAHHYARLRGVPSANLIYLDLPRGFGGIRAEITPDQFRRHILEPVRSEIAARRIQDHILAWVYSAGFPVRVLTEPPISLNGATFVRGEWPSSDAIAQAQFRSPFYRGPDKPGETGLPSASLQDFAVALKDQMPMPSMLLGYSANRGLPPSEIIAGHRRAAAADGSRPRDPFYYHISDDVRSTARRWQFDGAVQELKAIGLAAQLSSNRPPAAMPLSGLMLGVADTTDAWGRFQAGSIVDNLTSFGAEFHHHDQVRLTHWLAQGAAAAGGTVTEPYAAWPKFPHARLFAHYARGCTILESYLQALRSPLQQLLVGDPLARPWSRTIPLTLIGMEDTSRPLRGEAAFLASTLAAAPGLNYLFLLNGRYLPAQGSQPGIRFDTKNIADGWHELRAIVYSPGPIRQQGHARLAFTVDNFNRRAHIAADGDPGALDDREPVRIRVSASHEATGIVVVAHERVLWRGAASTQEQTVVLQPAAIGPGPAPLHALAVFPDGMTVRSPPLEISIRRAPQSAPALPFDESRLTDLMRDPPRGVTAHADSWTLVRTGNTHIVNLTLPFDADPRAIVFHIATHAGRIDTGPLVGGLAWDIRDAANYAYFGWHWTWGGWVAGRVRGGAFEPLHALGVPRPPDGDTPIRLLQDGEALTILIGGETFARDPALALKGPIGLVGGPIPWTLTRLRAAASPPDAPAP